VLTSIDILSTNLINAHLFHGGQRSVVYAVVH